MKTGRGSNYDRLLMKIALVAVLAWQMQSFVSRAATGPVVVDPSYPHCFRYQDGGRFFPVGDTAYYLIAQPTNVITHYIESRRAHKFNFIPGSYEVEWLHPETGRYYRLPDLTVAGGSREFVPPAHPTDDWVLHLRRRDPVENPGQE